MAYDTSILDQALSRRQANWEAQRQETLARLYQWLDKTADQFQLEQLYIFGSLIQANTFTDHSDIDLAVINLPDEHFFKLSAALSFALAYAIIGSDEFGDKRGASSTVGKGNEYLAT